MAPKRARPAEGQNVTVRLSPASVPGAAAWPMPLAGRGVTVTRVGAAPSGSSGHRDCHLNGWARSRPQRAFVGTEGRCARLPQTQTTWLGILDSREARSSHSNCFLSRCVDSWSARRPHGLVELAKEVIRSPQSRGSQPFDTKYLTG